MTPEQEIEIRTIYAARSAIRLQSMRAIDSHRQCLAVRANFYPQLRDKIYEGLEAFEAEIMANADICAPFPDWYQPEMPDRLATQEARMWRRWRY